MANIPPKYDDLGKESKDVFGKGYGFGSVKLDLKSKTKKGVVRLLFQCICRIKTKGSMAYQSLSTDRHFPDDEHVSGKNF